MPTPPRKGESKKDWLSRCASSPASQQEFPDIKQRMAYCYSVWERKKSTAAYVITANDDEILYTKATVTLPTALVEKLKGMPQSGPGYHMVKARGKSGKTYHGRANNCEEFETDEEEVEDDEIEDVEMDD
jgi:predicted DNA-binding protein (MmcQ/YjbR family)